MNGQSNNSELDTRPSPIAGAWYPSDPGSLRKSIRSYLDSAPLQNINGTIHGIIVPHAGHQYSGRTAAAAFKLLENLHPKVAAVISPFHHPAPGRLITSAHQAYRTPLGTIPINADLVHYLNQVLQDRFHLELTSLRNDLEHSLEIELPFLQEALDAPFDLLPVMMADQSIETAKGLGLALAEVLRNQDVILAASTDLSHFYSQDAAQQFDMEMLGRIEAFDPWEVMRAEEEGFGFACGRGAAAAVMWACQELGADSVHVLDYSTSGDVTGDFSSVVGYGSAVIYRQANVESRSSQQANRHDNV